MARFGGSLGVQALQGVYPDLTPLQSCNALGSGARRRQSGDGGNVEVYRGPPNRLLVKPGLEAMGRVDDEVNAIAFDEIDYVGPALFYFVHAFHGQAKRALEQGDSVPGYVLSAGRA